MTRRLRMLAACEMSGRVRDAFAARGWEAWSADLLPSETPVRYLAPRTQDSPTGGVAGHFQGDVRDLFHWSHPVNAGRKDAKQAHVDQLARDTPAGEYLPMSGMPLWDLVIAFPPCTDLSLAGARYWKEKQQRGPNGEPSKQDLAAKFFIQMVYAPSPLTAVENPVGIMGRKKNPLYRVPDQVVQPWMFGDPLIKNTCLWLRGLPQLTATHTVEDFPELERVATGGGSYRVDLRVKGRANNGHEDSEGRARRHIVRSRTPGGFARAMASQWGPFAEAYYA